MFKQADAATLKTGVRKGTKEYRDEMVKQIAKIDPDMVKGANFTTKAL